MSAYVINIEKNDASFPFKMRVYASCKKEKLQLVLIPKRAFWTKYQVLESNSETLIELDLKISTNLPFEISMRSNLNFFDIPLPFFEKRKNKQFLIIPNNSPTQITRNDSLQIKITFFKFPNFLTIQGKNAMTPCFRKKCF